MHKLAGLLGLAVVGSSCTPASGPSLATDAGSSVNNGNGNQGGGNGDGGNTGANSQAIYSLVLTPFPPLHNQTDGTWGTVLTDVVQHVPAADVAYWSFPNDRTTWAHESTHAVHSHLRISLSLFDSNGFYLLNDNAAVVLEPPIAKSSVADYVPNRLQGLRFSDYVSGTNWDDKPLYLFDEWIAYVNGGTGSLSVYDKGLWTLPWRDQSGVPEFVVYGIALGLAIEDQAPQYLNNEPQFLALMEHELRRSMALYQRFAVMDEFTGLTADNTVDDLRNHNAAQPHRDFVIRHFGAAFAADVMGF